MLDDFHFCSSTMLHAGCLPLFLCTNTLNCLSWSSVVIFVGKCEMSGSSRGEWSNLCKSHSDCMKPSNHYEVTQNSCGLAEFELFSLHRHTFMVGLTFCSHRNYKKCKLPSICHISADVGAEPCVFFFFGCWRVVVEMLGVASVFKAWGFDLVPYSLQLKNSTNH